MATTPTKKWTTAPRRVELQPEIRLARVEVVPDEQAPASESPVTVCIGMFRVEVSGSFSTETLAAVLDVLEGLQR